MKEKFKKKEKPEEEKKEEEKKEEEKKEDPKATTAGEEPEEGEEKEKTKTEKFKEKMGALLAGVPCLKKEWVDDEEDANNEKITPETHAQLYEKQHWWIWGIPAIVFLVVIIIISIAYSKNNKPIEQ